MQISVHTKHILMQSNQIYIKYLDDFIIICYVVNF